MDLGAIRLALRRLLGVPVDVSTLPGGYDYSCFLPVAYFTCSISPGFQVLSNHGWSGPLRRRMVFQPLPGTVCTQLAWPAGVAGPNQTSTEVSALMTMSF